MNNTIIRIVPPYNCGKSYSEVSRIVNEWVTNHHNYRLVGSQALGVTTAESDRDYVITTDELSDLLPNCSLEDYCREILEQDPDRMSQSIKFFYDESPPINFIVVPSKLHLGSWLWAKQIMLNMPLIYNKKQRVDVFELLRKSYMLTYGVK